MISSIVFINYKGEILIYRVYKDDITREETQNFCTRIVEKKESKECPIVLLDGTSYIHVASKDIILLATTKSNINAALAVQFLYSLINICKAYFGNDLDENHIKKHFVLIYELLDEIIDYGIPQLTEVQVLKKYIQEGGLKLDTIDALKALTAITNQATGASAWRAEGITYKKNEVYLDVVESVNTLISHKGTILRSSVNGEVKIVCQLSGMPDCKFGLNDKLVMQREQKDDRGISIDDIKFHQCVKLGKFDKERAITFVPPDGKFDLMTYRVTQNINLPFKITPDVQELSESKIEYKIFLKSLFEHNYYATNVTVKIPCPKNTVKTTSHSSIGKAKLEPEHGAIMWRIKKMSGQVQTELRCEVNLSTNSSVSLKNWTRPPISLDFTIPMYTASGLRVRFLKIVEKSPDYKAVKWIRYVTKSGEYQHRIQIKECFLAFKTYK